MKEEKKDVMLTVRISKTDYEILKEDFQWYLDNSEYFAIFYLEIKTFSEYLRYILNKGLNN